MSFYSITEFNKLSPLNVMNRFTLEQFKSQIKQNYRKKFGGGEGPTVLGIRKIIGKVQEIYFNVDASRLERACTVC